MNERDALPMNRIREGGRVRRKGSTYEWESEMMADFAHPGDEPSKGWQPLSNDIAEMLIADGLIDPNMPETEDDDGEEEEIA